MDTFTIVNGVLYRNGVPQECPQWRGSMHGHTGQCSKVCPHLTTKQKGGSWYAVLKCEGIVQELLLASAPT